MMDIAAPPANIGQRLVPILVDEIAATDPGRVLYSISKSKNPADGFQDITAKEFARAVDRCAWHLVKTLGDGENFPTLTYLGPQDIMYAVLILASVKAGYKLLLNSPRNTLEAHLELFKKTECNTFLLPTNFPLPIVKQILEARPMKVVEFARLPHWIAPKEDGTQDKPFPYTKSFQEARSEPFVVLHTSGSTGIPKPIVQTHGTLTPLDAFTALPSQGFAHTYPAMCRGKRVYLAFPLFHCAGVSMLLPGSLYAGFTVVLGPFPPSAESANAVHVHGNVQHSCLPPMTLIELVKSPENLENLKLLEQVTYGGGPCPPAVGDLIASKTRLLNCLGTTECGVLPVQLCDQDSWSYMSFSPALGHEFRLVSGDLYEQVIVRKPELDLYQGIFQTFPDLQEWPMKDLYSKHPTKESHWLYRGRADDIIVYSTGEKLNPIDIEGAISAHPSISAALIAGNGRFQSSLLVEVADPPTIESEAENLINIVWPLVEDANKLSPTHGYIHRNMIIFTSPNKPMLRAGKGTIQRKLTLDLYNAELDALYIASENLAAPTGASPKALQNQTPEQTVQAILTNATGIDVDILMPDSDLFELGLNSLEVTVVVRQMNQHLLANNKAPVVDTKIVYENPSLDGLSAVLAALLNDKHVVHNQNPVTAESLYQQYTTNFPLSARQAQPKPSDNRVFLLTGSTGNLGSYVLDALQRDPGVSHIYCLNRGPDSLYRQQASQASKGLTIVTSKVEILNASLDKAYFGLKKSEFLKLLAKVTHIIHNAWQVDFNLTLPSFSAHIKALRNLAEFSLHSKYGAEIFFISSIDAVSGVGGKVEERIYQDSSTPMETGYGQSKFVSERLLNFFVKDAGIPAVICRVGQIAGPTTPQGLWPNQEWLPSLIFSSQYMKKLPATLGQLETVDWIPVDILSRVIVELSTSRPTEGILSGARVFHAINPKPSTWEQLLPVIKDTLVDIEVVPLHVWVASLQGQSREVGDISLNPATKIIKFYERLLDKEKSPISLETNETIQASPTLAGLEPIDRGLLENWLRQWGFTSPTN